MKNDIQKIVIIGRGRFGNYFLNQLRKNEFNAFAFDLKQSPEILREASIVIFAVPIRDFKLAVEKYKKYIYKTTIIFDVCSVKVYPCEILQEKFPDNIVIGTHPLFGPQSAPEECIGQRIALCPINHEYSTKIQPVIDIFNKLGLNIIICSPEEHDKQMCSQVMDHLIGRAASEAGIHRVQLSTATHDLFMNIVDIINGNSKELFYDMNNYNPFAEETRSSFHKALLNLELNIRQEYLKIK